MSIRDNREQQRRMRAQGGRRASRQPGRRLALTQCTALVLLAGLVLAAFMAPAGQARGARRERSPEEEATIVAAKEASQIEREERKQIESEERAAAKAQREAERSAARAQRTANKRAGSLQGGARHGVQNSSRPRVNGDVEFTCTGVTWNFKEFPEGTNTVITVYKLFGEGSPVILPRTFTFTGTSDEATTPFVAPPGSYNVDAWAKWKGNGLKGSFDILGKLTCAAAPALSIEKLQRLANGPPAYTTSPLSGEVGDTVEYEIVVTNSGNVPLTLTEFTDPNCGPVSGGPGSAELAPGAKTTYTCTRVLESPGPHLNTAEVHGDPPYGEGTPVGGTSNTVTVETSSLPANPTPAFSIEKLQRIAGGSGSYTTSELTGAAVGETVEYEIVVSNTGNVPLTLGSFTDAQCDSGTVAGGPGSAALPVGASTTYTCKHLLDAADQEKGSYSNTVSVTGTPPDGGGLPVTNSSNTVVTVVLAASNTATSGTTGSASSGVLSSTFSEPAKSGVLAFASATLPKLKGPQGCVRHSFHISIKSADVASVTFYMDGHKLKRLTAKNARKGLLTIAINPDKLKVGVHKLVAKITMTATASTKAKQGSRMVRVLRCSSKALTPKFTG
jgi:uncharacterized repeat protein (TIGR01451 family)